MLGARMALWNAAKRLPYDAEVEYLESTGTQWIDTGVLADGEFDAEYTISTPSTLRNFIVGGARSSTQHLNFGQYEAGGNFVLAYLENYWTALNTSNPNTLYTTKVHYASGSQTATVNGVSAQSRQYTGTEALGRTIYLFKRNVYGASDPILPMIGRMYSFKIWQNGVLVRDYIPVRKGTVGYLYDRVSKRLFGNAGTGDFIVGPDVVPVEYVENSGTQRIDTGFKADNTCKFRIDMERRGGRDYWLFGSRNGTSTATDKSCLYASVNSSIGYAMMGSAMPSFNSTLIKDGKHMIEMSFADGLVIDGDVSATYTASEQAEVFTNSYPMSIFTMYNGSSYFNAFAGRVYLFSITSGGVSRLNLLPVRVGSGSTWEGAMMDTLTRRIYRNAGTGAFSYGNDLPLETLAN